jgi:hypothetical protein
MNGIYDYEDLGIVDCGDYGFGVGDTSFDISIIDKAGNALFFKGAAYRFCDILIFKLIAYENLMSRD